MCPLQPVDTVDIATQTGLTATDRSSPSSMASPDSLRTLRELQSHSDNKVWASLYYFCSSDPFAQPEGEGPFCRSVLTAIPKTPSGRQ